MYGLLCTVTGLVLPSCVALVPQLGEPRLGEKIQSLCHALADLLSSPLPVASVLVRAIEEGSGAASAPTRGMCQLNALQSGKSCNSSQTGNLGSTAGGGDPGKPRSASLGGGRASHAVCGVLEKLVQTWGVASFGPAPRVLVVLARQMIDAHKANAVSTFQFLVKYGGIDTPQSSAKRFLPLVCARGYRYLSGGAVRRSSRARWKNVTRSAGLRFKQGLPGHQTKGSIACVGAHAPTVLCQNASSLSGRLCILALSTFTTRREHARRTLDRMACPFCLRSPFPKEEQRAYCENVPSQFRTKLPCNVRDLLRSYVYSFYAAINCERMD